MMTANLILAWTWMLLGFVSGLVMGLFFHRSDWLGGYGSHQRRLYRLGHISFFGLGAVNLLFWLTSHLLGLQGLWIEIASIAFLLGAVTMPVCCALMAHFLWTRHLFVVPVLSLLTGATIILMEVVP